MKTKRILIFLIIIIALGFLAYYYPRLTGEAVNDNNNNIEYQREDVFVNRVIDGDTIETSNGTIRLLGINTPEKKMPYYAEARDFLKQIENKSVEILRDKEDIDKYDRKLRYVFYENRLLNIEILENGLATSFMLEDLKYEDKLKQAEDYAKNNGIRLWEKSREDCAKCIKLVELNYSAEYFIINNDCDFDCDLNGWTAKDDANHIFKLESLNAEQEKRYDSKTKIWNDEGDRFFMRDETGKLVVFYEY